MRVLLITSEWPSPEHPDWSPYIAQQVRFLREAGVSINVFHFRGKGKLSNYMRSCIKLRKVHDFRNYDLIHAHFGQSGLLALPTQLPLVVTFWGSDLHGIFGPDGRYTRTGYVLRFLSCLIARRAKEIILVSEHLSDYLPNEMYAHVIPQGVDLDLFRPIPLSEARRRLCLPKNKRYVLFASNPNSPVKRYFLAQEAIKIVKKQLDVELIALSGLPHDLVPMYMNASDVLLLTSKHEGSPTVVKEALACKLPVVSVTVGDVVRQIGGVGGCVLCHDDSPGTIARGITRVLQDRNRINGRGANGDLDERFVAKRIIRVYRSALKKSTYQKNCYGESLRNSD